MKYKASESKYKLSDFDYDFPEELIADQPVERRDESKLMLFDRQKKQITQGVFKNVVDYMDEGDCLVLNRTRVFPARLFGVKDRTNAQIEMLLLRELQPNLWETLVRPARKVRTGNVIRIGEEITAEVIDNTTSGGRVLLFNYEGNFYKMAEKYGSTPLPPYIKREAEDSDRQNYQTVYARDVGAVAAPTAGLHFTKELLKEIMKKKIKIVTILLHIGYGTFRPVQVEDILRHKMDSEWYELKEAEARVINETKEKGKRVIAVGTSTTRTLEASAVEKGVVKANKGWTDMFIYPPYEYKIIDGLITNFHQPRSTLLMLVSAFAGLDNIKKVYKKAIKEKYRLFSYGDAMFLM